MVLLKQQNGILKINIGLQNDKKYTNRNKKYNIYKTEAIF